MHPTALPAHTDIAIVGAGPTGLALAVTLASAGIDFVLVDRQAEGANTSRAAVVHARTLEVLENIGAAEITLTSDDIAEIDTRSAQLTVAGARGSGHETYR